MPTVLTVAHRHVSMLLIAVAGMRIDLLILLEQHIMQRLCTARGGGPLARLFPTEAKSGLWGCSAVVESPVTVFVLAQGTHQMGCTIAEFPGVEYSTVKPAGAADITRKLQTCHLHTKCYRLFTTCPHPIVHTVTGQQLEGIALCHTHDTVLNRDG